MSKIVDKLLAMSHEEREKAVGPLAKKMRKAKTVWQLREDGIYSSVEEVPTEGCSDHELVYDSFLTEKQALKELLKTMRQTVYNYRVAISDAKKRLEEIG